MKGKILSLALAGMMLFAALAGCTAPTPTPAAATNAPAVATEKPTEAPPTEPPKPELSDIAVEIFDRGTDGGRTDPVNNYYTNWVKEKLLKDENINITFKAVSRWEEEPQLNNLMAANNAPDVCLTYSAGLVNNYRDLGGLTDMAPYVDTLLIDLKKFLGPDPSLPGRDLINRNLVSETGKLFSIQARRVNLARCSTFIRKDWLDKLNLKLPTTAQEFHDALKAFKEQDPGGVGKDKVVAFTMSNDVRWMAGNLIESFIDPNLGDRERWINLVDERNYLQPGYKEGVRLMNQMYNEGLIDRDFPTYKDDVTSGNLVKSGVAGAFSHNWDQPYRDSPGILKDLLVNVPTAQIVSIDPFKNSAGVTAKLSYDAAGVHFFVPLTCKVPESALRYINWLSKIENYGYLQIGDAGVTHELVNGVPKIISAANEKIMNSPQNIDYTIMVNGLELGDAEKNIKAIANGYAVDPTLIMTAYEHAMNNAKPNLVVPVTLTKLGPVQQTLVTKSNELLAKTICCKPEEFDALWESLIKDILASGAQDVIDERAAQYDAYMAKQK
jgi:putative aldouronate transport system substrate-binding protein